MPNIVFKLRHASLDLPEIDEEPPTADGKLKAIYFLQQHWGLSKLDFFSDELLKDPESQDYYLVALSGALTLDETAVDLRNRVCKSISDYLARLKSAANSIKRIKKAIGDLEELFQKEGPGEARLNVNEILNEKESAVKAMLQKIDSLYSLLKNPDKYKKNLEALEKDLFQSILDNPEILSSREAQNVIQKKVAKKHLPSVLEEIGINIAKFLYKKSVEFFLLNTVNFDALKHVSVEDVTARELFLRMLFPKSVQQKDGAQVKTEQEDQYQAAGEERRAEVEQQAENQQAESDAFKDFHPKEDLEEQYNNLQAERDSALRALYEKYAEKGQAFEEPLKGDRFSGKCIYQNGGSIESSLSFIGTWSEFFTHIKALSNLSFETALVNPRVHKAIYEAYCKSVFFSYKERGSSALSQSIEEIFDLPWHLREYFFCSKKGLFQMPPAWRAFFWRHASQKEYKELLKIYERFGKALEEKYEGSGVKYTFSKMIDLLNKSILEDRAAFMQQIADRKKEAESYAEQVMQIHIKFASAQLVNGLEITGKPPAALMLYWGHKPKSRKNVLPACIEKAISVLKAMKPASGPPHFLNPSSERIYRHLITVSQQGLFTPPRTTQPTQEPATDEASLSSRSAYGI